LPPASNRAFLQRYAEPNAISNAIGYADFYNRSHDALIYVYDEAGNVIEAQEHAKDNVVYFCSDQAVSSFTHVVL
jgi:hypothetical protein